MPPILQLTSGACFKMARRRPILKRSSASSNARSNRAVGIPPSCANSRCVFGERFLRRHDLAYLLQVADQLFLGRVLEEKIFAVFLLQGLVGEFGKHEFKMFESWLDRVSTWADHDGLVHYLIGPMIARDESLLTRPPRWAKSKNRWHQRAAAVSLIHTTRQHKNFDHIQRITEMLLAERR